MINSLKRTRWRKLQKYTIISFHHITFVIVWGKNMKVWILKTNHVNRMTELELVDKLTCNAKLLLAINEDDTDIEFVEWLINVAGCDSC